MITHINIVSVLDDCLSDYTMVLKELKTIDKDTPVTHAKLEELDAIIIRTQEDDVPALMDFVFGEKVDEDRVGNRMHQILYLFVDIMKEKTRILNNTPQVFKDTNDMTGMN